MALLQNGQIVTTFNERCILQKVKNLFRGDILAKRKMIDS